jgi:hypothetical protein
MTSDERAISDCLFLAAQTRVPSGERLIDRLIIHANMVRTARKARWTPTMIAILEDELVSVLAQFYRRVEWYRGPAEDPFPRN